MDIGHLNNNGSITDTNDEILSNGNETSVDVNKTPDNDNVKPDDDNTILDNLVNELVDMFFDFKLKKDKYGEEHFDSRIEEKFKKNFKTNFHGFTEEKIKEVGNKKENIGKAMLAFSAMFDEGGIEGYEEKLAKKELSKRLEKVFFSEKGALEYCKDPKNNGDDEIIKAIKYKGANIFVKYNKENCKIEDDKIVVKEGKDEKQSLLRDTDTKIPSLDNSRYFKIDEIKKYLEDNDPKLKKFIETRNLILSGNDDIINKFLKEYDKIQNSKYAKKIKEYQKNYSEKKKRAEEINKLDKENDIRIGTIEENEKKIDEAKENKKKANALIEDKKTEINKKKGELKKIGLLNRILNKKAAKEAKIIKESIKTGELFIKKTQNYLKELKKTIKEKKKINEDHKKDICKSVKEINKNYHTGKVELKYKDLKDKKGSKINEIYGKEVKDKVSEDTKSVLNDSYKGKHFKKLQEAEKKLQKEHRKNIFSSKKIEKIIRNDKVNTEMNKNKDIINLKNSLETLKGITKESGIKNNTILSKKIEQENNLTQQQ